MGLWASQSTAGLTAGPASSTLNAIARYADTSGLLLKDSGVIVDDSGNVIIPGSLTVPVIKGPTTIIEGITLQVEDKNMEIGKVATPTDDTADGGGITLLPDKTIIWRKATNSWDFNQKIRTGNLEFDTNTIRSTNTDGDILLLPNGTGNVGIGGLTQGSIIFAGASGILSQDNTNLFWDDTNNFLRVKQLGISQVSGFAPDLDANIHIADNTTTKFRTTTASAGVDDSSFWNMERSRGTLVAKTTLLDGDRIGRFSWDAHTGAGFSTAARLDIHSRGAANFGSYEFESRGSDGMQLRAVLDQNGLDIKQGLTVDATTLFVDATNNRVGIGTVTPDEKLHVAKSVIGSSVLALFENSQASAAGITSHTAELRFGFGGDNDVARILVGKENDYTNAALSDSFLAFYTDFNGAITERMRITANGRVGIGEIAPEASLHINNSFLINNNEAIKFKAAGGTIHKALTVESTDDVFIGSSSFDSIRFKVGTLGEAVIIEDVTGNVGIGTAVPDSRLHVIAAGNPAKFESTSGNGRIEIDAPSTKNAGVQFFENNVLKWGIFNQGTDGTLKFQNKDFATRMIVQQGGNVGFGTIDPQTNFHIQENNIDTVPTVEIEQLSTGDAALQFSIAGDAYAIGIDNSDADKFKISYAAGAGTAVLGTNDRFVIDATGNVVNSGTVTASNLKAHALIENRAPGTSTTSTTFVTLQSASAVTFSGRPLLCFVSVTMFPSVADLTVELAIQIDAGADAVAAQLLHNETEHNTVQGAVIVTPTAGSHTLRVRWRISGGSGTLTLDANDQILLHAVEL